MYISRNLIPTLVSSIGGDVVVVDESLWRANDKFAADDVSAGEADVDLEENAGNLKLELFVKLAIQIVVYR